MTETMPRTALGEKILRHWREHCPQMVRDLERQNRLDQAVFEAQETTGDLLYELVSVKKMNYPAAWELAAQEWALPESGSQEETTSGDLPPPAEPLRDLDPAEFSGELAPAAPAAPPRDFRITEAHRIGQGGLKEKARDNIAAIRTLRLVEDESREASDSEKALLARYSGWGALRERLPSLSAQRLAGDRPRRQGTSDPRGIRLGARLDAERAFHIADGDRGALAGAASASGSRKARKILEPSMGVGHFFGLMPESLLPGCRRTGVELDSITARIAKQLYPGCHDIREGI